MEETLVKENVCCSGHTCVTLQNRRNENLAVSAGNLKRLQICSNGEISELREYVGNFFLGL
jgi:hypothetical protein